MNPTDQPEGLLRDTTQTVLREAILDGTLPAGQKLVERELVEMTGASRSILREALSNLEARGLIEHQSFRGYTVARIEPRSVYEIFELRVAVETLAAELFTERASDQEIADIAASFARLSKVIKTDNVQAIRRAKSDFFSILFTGCRNAEIRRALENVIDRISFLRSRLMSDPNRRKEALVEMQTLARALERRDRFAARAASINHLTSARNALLAMLAEDPDRGSI